jgi:hypothetical protein
MSHPLSKMTQEERDEARRPKRYCDSCGILKIKVKKLKKKNKKLKSELLETLIAWKRFEAVNNGRS